MSGNVITVDGLSKRYLLGETGPSRFLANGFRRAFTRLDQLADAETAEKGQFIWALKNVSFEVGRGEIVGIIGRNGAGKSTLLKILSRITRPTSGFAQIRGRVGSLLEVGTGFHQELTGRENIFLNGVILGMSRSEIQRRFDEIVAFSEVERFLDTPVKRYSSGMYMRLAFAVAAHLNPEILIVDEVLAVGDALFQQKCLSKIDDVAQEGRTVLFVSHRMDAIRRLCGTVILLNDGIMKYKGDPHTAICRYLDNVELNACLGDRGPRSEKTIHLRSARVVGTEGKPCNFLARRESAAVEVVYEINRKVAGIHVFARLLNSDDVTIFSTADCDAGDNLYREREPGLYRANFGLPTELLNEGDYSITFWVGIPFGATYDRIPHAIRFHIVDLRTNGGPRYIQSRPGLIVQDITWDTTYLSCYERAPI